MWSDMARAIIFPCSSPRESLKAVVVRRILGMVELSGRDSVRPSKKVHVCGITWGSSGPHEFRWNIQPVQAKCPVLKEP